MTRRAALWGQRARSARRWQCSRTTRTSTSADPRERGPEAVMGRLELLRMVGAARLAARLRERTSCRPARRARCSGRRSVRSTPGVPRRGLERAGVAGVWPPLPARATVRPAGVAQGSGCRRRTPRRAARRACVQLPDGVVPTWSHSTHRQSGIALLVQAAFLRRFGPVAQDDWEVVLLGRLAAMHGPALSIAVAYFASGSSS